MADEEQALNSYDSKPDDGNEIASYCRGLFDEFKTARLPYEAKAQEWWDNFNSRYAPVKNWRIKEGEDNRSRVFVKITQLKCYTAQAKVMDALGAELPFGLEPLKTLNYNLDPKAVSKICDQRKKYLADYVKYNKFMDVLDDCVLDSTIFPCGVMKGPIMVRVKQLSVRPRMIGGMPAQTYNPDMNAYETVEEMTDKYIFENVPWWDYYVDPNAKSIEDSIAEMHFKRMLPGQFQMLNGLPGYHPEAMREAINNMELLATQGDRDDDKLQLQLADNFMGDSGVKDKKISVLEIQGMIKAVFLRKRNAWVPENVKDDDYVEGIVTLAGTGAVIRAQYNVFGARQFLTLRWKKVPGSVYGHGPAGLMDDSQSIINSSARMIIDNKALSGNGCLVVNLSKMNMLKTKNMQVYPRKVFYTKDGALPKEVVDSLTFPDITNGLKDLMQMFIQVADEETAIPKYSSGEQSSFLNKTASGMSMILGQVNINLKPVLKNIDENIIEPAMERLDKVLSAMNIYPQEINIPLKVVASGTLSVMAKEIIVENLLKLLQITQNPDDSIIMNRRDVIREIATKLGFSEFVKTEEEIQQIEQMLAAKQAQQPLENKGRVDIDKLYPMLSRMEQAQVLQSIGIKPDPSYAGGLNPQTVAQEAVNTMPPPGMQPQGMPDPGMMGGPGGQ